MEEIKKWKEVEIKNTLKAWNSWVDELKELKDKGYKIHSLAKYQDANPLFRNNYYTSRERMKQIISDEVDIHFNKLQNKVEDKIGKILKIEPTGENGYDFSFIGESGNCEIKVILAGGYNIQRLHTRWIIKK
jgi:hypothetical protein